MLDHLFEISGSYLRLVVGLDEDDIKLILEQFSSIFDTYELSLSIYKTNVILQVVFTMEDHEGTLQYEYDDIRNKTKSF